MARIVILGGGGHARSLWPIIACRHPQNVAPLYAKDNDSVEPDDIVYIGVGADLEKRRMLFKKFHSQILNCGQQLMANVYIGPDVLLGDNVLVNTGAQIDHGCWIEDHCVISPGAILCGGVKLGESCFIGAGAIIVENVELEPETYVPAGTLVVSQSDFRRPQRVV